jgi:predicted transcriptional regulator of viral defense system
MSSPLQNGLTTAIALFRSHGGTLRTKDALSLGIHPRSLYAMRDRGIVESLARGLYRLADAQPLGNPDLVTVALKIPNAVICLISALAFHELTTQVPHEVSLALNRGAEQPRIEHPPVRTYRFTGKSFTEGIEIQQVDRVSVRIYSPEKTLADCFKFRNKIGLDVALEALRFYKERKHVNVDTVMRFAEVCRVTKVVRPYAEALL